MLAAFLLAKSSPRLHARILQTKTYNAYVRPFKEKGGMPRATKIRAIAISLGVLAVSAAIVRIWYGASAGRSPEHPCLCETRNKPYRTGYFSK